MTLTHLKYLCRVQNKQIHPLQASLNEKHFSRFSGPNHSLRAGGGISSRFTHHDNQGASEEHKKCFLLLHCGTPLHSLLFLCKEPRKFPQRNPFTTRVIPVAFQLKHILFSFMNGTSTRKRLECFKFCFFSASLTVLGSSLVFLTTDLSTELAHVP